MADSEVVTMEVVGEYLGLRMDWHQAWVAISPLMLIRLMIVTA